MARDMEINSNVQINTNLPTKKILMWQITSSQADLWFTISNIFLIIGAVAVLVGTIGAVTTSSIRDHFSDQRISENEKQIALAQKDVEVAKEGAAKALRFGS